jgi:prepilin-type N-terminal cleavage/methylation domain-containing protein
VHLTHSSVKTTKASAGFTILELLIATSVFSVILLVISTGVISFSRQYYKGVNSSNTQAAARAIMSETTQAIQFGQTIATNIPSSPADNKTAFCVDNKLFSYIIGQQVTDASPNPAKHQGFHGLVVNSNGVTCGAVGTVPQVPTVSTLALGQRELLGEHMRLSALDVQTADSSLYTIHVRVIYGDDDLLTPAVSATTDWSKENCDSQSGSQFCAVSDLTTTVQKRL